VREIRAIASIEKRSIEIVAKLGIERSLKEPQRSLADGMMHAAISRGMARRATVKSRKGSAIPLDLSDEMVVLPIQLVTPLRLKMNGVRRLMAAILTDGVESFCKTLGAASKKKQTAAAEASAWIFSDDRSGLFSFLNLCEALDMDPAYVRDGLRRWKDTHSHRRLTANPGLGQIARLLALA
jgi:hypothetical protein